MTANTNGSQGSPQEFERSWWGTCANTYGEETKQLVYAKHMGLERLPDPQGHGPYRFDLQGESVLDIGGGPASLLLKCDNRGACAVVDPCPYPAWTYIRYAAVGIKAYGMPAEALDLFGYDEVWLYNVLQHVVDPAKVIRNARRAAKVIRIFEWLNIPPHEGHPHMLMAQDLSIWLGWNGTVGTLDGEGGCWGTYFAGAGYCG